MNTILSIELMTAAVRVIMRYVEFVLSLYYLPGAFLIIAHRATLQEQQSVQSSQLRAGIPSIVAGDTNGID